MFAHDGIPFALVAVKDRVGKLRLTGSPGAAVITAAYTGDSRYAPVASTDRHGTSVVAEWLTPNPAPCGQEIQVKIQVRSNAGGNVSGLTDSIVFRSGNTVLAAQPHPWRHLVYSLPRMPPGTHALLVTFAGNQTYRLGSTTSMLEVSSSMDASIEAAALVNANEASVASAHSYSGASYEWTIENGVITAGQGTSTIHYTPGPAGRVSLHLTIAMGTCTGTSTTIVPIVPVPRLPRRRGARS